VLLMWVMIYSLVEQGGPVQEWCREQGSDPEGIKMGDD
jgi:hypothetical protein